MKCKCGSENFFIEKNGNNMGLYCKKCGKWIKWATKEETRIYQNKDKKETIKVNLKDFVDFLDEEIDRQLTREPLSSEDNIMKCTYATAYEKVKTSLLNIVEGRKYNEYN